MEPSDNTMNDVLGTKAVSFVTSVGIIMFTIKVTWTPSQHKDTIL